MIEMWELNKNYCKEGHNSANKQRENKKELNKEINT
jgi:hypothetical protein